MTLTAQHRPDHLIQKDVTEELAWAPQVDGAHVGVAVLDGVVTLSGDVDSYTEKIEAKNAALRVKGVSTVANALVIHGVLPPVRTDADIAAAIRHTLEWSTGIPYAEIEVDVRDQVVVLTGTVDWNYQRVATENLVRTIHGVVRVDNDIHLSPRVSAAGTSQLIKDALVRHALLDANAISVTTVGSEVTLGGHVSTWVEKHAAAHAAWSSPHITAVHNKITIRA